NLLGNAVKFTPEGGALGLDVDVDEQQREIRLAVWDRGIGIKPEDMEKLFKPFTQVDSRLAREYGGTGLGLSLVDKLARMHGGRVQVESVFGQGSTFTIVLPWQG
ncbi:MAG: ATP-binding protein, partial [Chloroflexota bacterium]